MELAITDQVVVDANVVAKFFMEEPDSSVAVQLLRYCVEQQIALVAPGLLEYELAQVAARQSVPLEEVMRVFDEDLSVIFDLERPSMSVWAHAEKIVKSGHRKSGFPTIYDCVYHAMAISLDCLFITADKRHYEKAKGFGHIALLDCWESALKGG